MNNSQINAAIRRLNEYFISEGIPKCYSLSKTERAQKYCQLVGLEIPSKRGIDEFFHKEYMREGSKIYHELRVQKRPRKIKDKIERKAKGIERRKVYVDYINSAAWRRFRKSIIDVRGHRCEICGREDRIIHAHHLTYKRLGKELPEDIQLVCVTCHEEIHSKDIGKPKKGKKQPKTTAKKNPNTKTGRSAK